MTPGDDAAWGTPFVLPLNSASGLDADDISTLVTYQGRTGVLWSSQTGSAVRFSAHEPGTPVTTWGQSTVITVPGAGQADDHLNIKSFQADDSGRLYAVIKTSLESTGASAPSIVVLSRGTTGGWTRATFGTAADCHTRPQLVLDSSSSTVHVFATAPDSGCTNSGAAGTIFTKSSPMDALSFAPGRGTPVLRDSTSANLNNVTSTKQTVSATTGLALLASDDVKQQYWTAYRSLGGSTPPPPPPPPATTTTVTRAAVADTWADSGAQTTAHGSDAALTVDSGPDRTAYLRFDLSGLAGRSVTSAVLRVRVGSNGSAGAQAVRSVADDRWTESALVVEEEARGRCSDRLAQRDHREHRLRRPAHRLRPPGRAGRTGLAWPSTPRAPTPSSCRPASPAWPRSCVLTFS